jgi:hypothetical protein
MTVDGTIMRDFFDRLHCSATIARLTPERLATVAVAVLLTLLPRLAARREAIAARARGMTYFKSDPTDRTSNGSSAGNLWLAA